MSSLQVPAGKPPGLAALSVGLVSLALQPAALLIALVGDHHRPATDGGIVLSLGLSILLGLLAFVLGVASYVRLRSAPGSRRGLATAALVLGLLSPLSALAVGLVAFFITSDGSWIYLS